VVFVAGLPGSGKTRLLQSSADPANLFDDFKSNAISDNPAFDHARRLPELLALLRAGQTCFVSDIDLCREPAQEDAENYLRAHVPGLVIEWLFFEKSPEQCKANVRVRATVTGRDAELEAANVERYAACYSIPRGATVRPVWKP